MLKHLFCRARKQLRFAAYLLGLGGAADGKRSAQHVCEAATGRHTNTNTLPNKNNAHCESEHENQNEFNIENKILPIQLIAFLFPFHLGASANTQSDSLGSGAPSSHRNHRNSCAAHDPSSVAAAEAGCLVCRGMRCCRFTHFNKAAVRRCQRLTLMMCLLLFILLSPRAFLRRRFFFIPILCLFALK